MRNERQRIRFYDTDEFNEFFHKTDFSFSFMASIVSLERFIFLNIYEDDSTVPGLYDSLERMKKKEAPGCVGHVKITIPLFNPQDFTVEKLSYE